MLGFLFVSRDKYFDFSQQIVAVLVQEVGEISLKSHYDIRLGWATVQRRLPRPNFGTHHPQRTGRVTAIKSQGIR